MAQTTGYSAGVESNAAQIQYGVESAWGTAPAVAFKAIRVTSESLKRTQNRQRPQELNATRQLQGAVTTDISAAGSVNFALSYGTFDDIVSCLMGSDWPAVTTIAGSSGDISVAAGQFTSTTAGKFTALTPGQQFFVSGFANASNNGWFYLVSKPDNQTLSVGQLRSGTGSLVNETPTGSTAKLKYSTLRNGATFKSMFLEKQLSPSLFLQYPGSYPTAAQLTFGTKNFASGNFSFLSKDEVSATASSSTGSIVAAPSGLVFNPCANWLTALWKPNAGTAAPFTGAVDQFQLNLANNGAAQEYALGSSAAQGIIGGLFGASASLRFYFNSFTEYQSAIAETAGLVIVYVADAAGSGYAITMPNVTLVNPAINAGGVNQPVMATFNIEANPDPVVGCTLQIERNT